MTSEHEVSALGQPFALGMLYDARDNKIIPGITLWDCETLQKSIYVEPKPKSNYKITTSDSLAQKTSALDVSGSMKANFLGGLGEVGGSAKYLVDKRKFKNQKRLIIEYTATTTYKCLLVNDLKTKNTQLVDDALKSSATHVVTAILYGANAFFVFDSERLESTNTQDIQGKIEAAIKNLPKVTMEGQASLKLSDEDKSLINNLSCKFYGDFILKSNPTTFEEAIKSCQELSNLLLEDAGKSVPMKVWLMPLKILDSKAAELKKEICDGIIRAAEDVLQDMMEMEMRCNDCLDDQTVKKIPEFNIKLNRFKRLCSGYTRSLKQTMKQKFPSIRAGEDDSSVEKLFEDRDRSPFSKERLNKWMDDKEREINVVKSCVGIMDSATIVSKKSELESKVLGPGVKHALCFIFTSLGSPEPYLDELEDFSHSHDTQRARNVAQVTQSDWYSSVREKAETFQSLTKALKSSRVCFLVAALDNEKYKGASIYHYKDGFLHSEDFSKPAIHAVETVKDKNDLIWHACDLTLDPNTVNGYLILSEGNKKATCGSWQYYPEHPERFDHPQVLCEQGLTGCCYWEVEWSEVCPDVGIGVTYKGIVRKEKDDRSKLGSNVNSWYFGLTHELSAWHSGEQQSIPLPSAGCGRVGVYLDFSAGTLSFYRVTPNSNTVTHLYTFHTQFTEPVYPGFYIYNTSNFAVLCPVV